MPLPTYTRLMLSCMQPCLLLDQYMKLSLSLKSFFWDTFLTSLRCLVEIFCEKLGILRVGTSQEGFTGLFSIVEGFLWGNVVPTVIVYITQNRIFAWLRSSTFISEINETSVYDGWQYWQWSIDNEALTIKSKQSKFVQRSVWIQVMHGIKVVEMKCYHWTVAIIHW